MRLDAKTIQWATRRKISAETLKKMNVGAEIIRFGERQLPSIAFHYLDANGESVNFKARALNEKSYKQKANGQQQFFNQAAVMAGPMDEVYIVEGEMDACATPQAITYGLIWPRCWGRPVATGSSGRKTPKTPTMP